MQLRPARLRALPIPRLSPHHSRPAFLFCCSFTNLSSLVSCETPWYELLRRAAEAGDIALGLRAHVGVVVSGLSSDVLLSNNLISMYAKCGLLTSARLAFDHAPRRDTATWNSLLSAYAQHERLYEGCFLFRLMVRSRVQLTTRSFTPVLKLCFGTENGLLAYSRSVHCLAFRTGLALAPFVASSLVAAYSKHDDVIDARRVFDKMDDADRDVVLWNIMINAYGQSGSPEEAFFLFSELHRSGTCPIDGGLNSVLAAGGETNWHSLQARAIALKLGFCDDDVAAVPGIVLSWNKRVSEHVRNGDVITALECFAEMRRAGVECDYVTLVVVLSAAADAGCAEVGEQLHGLALKLGLCCETPVSNTVINMYSRAGCLDNARNVFDEMGDRDLVSWNTMISSYVQDGVPEESVILLLSMVATGILPDKYTLATIFRACSSVEGLPFCQQVHSFAAKSGLITDKFVSTALVNAYVKKGSLHEAKCLVNTMGRFDMAHFNALISGYVDNGNHQDALKLFLDICRHSNESPDGFTLASVFKACSGLVAYEQGRQIHTLALKLNYGSDLCVSGGILDMYIKCGDKESAHACFSSMPMPDDVAWTAMISGSVENGDEEHALSLYHQMRCLGILADEFILASLIKACSCLTALERGKQIHANIIKMACVSDSYVATSLMDMYAKCGMVDESYLLFNQMGRKNIYSWNAMVVGLAQHGNAEEALDLFRSMLTQGLKPDKITFVGVLSACSHSGLVSEAYRYFDSMYEDHGILPEVEHYCCLVDVLGRAGRLAEAEKVIETMPFEGSVNMYRALLGACRIKGDTDMANRMVSRLLHLDPFDSSAYVLLSNIYASTNEWDKADQTRKLMRKRNVKKDPGYSWVEVKNKVHTFVVDDRSHPDSPAIYKKLDDLINRIKDEGYVPDTSITLHNVEEEEKESSLHYHSEKLAISYGLMVIAKPSIIRIIKNLRVCGDCHTAIKYISKVADREIVVRDANRFHHFKHGVCSCGDYW